MTCHDTGFFSSFLPTPLFIKSNSLPGKWWFKDNPFLLGPKKRPFSGARLDSGRKSKYPVCMAVGDSLYEWTGTSQKGICQNENDSENYLQHHQNNWRIIFYLYQKKHTKHISYYHAVVSKCFLRLDLIHLSFRWLAAVAIFFWHLLVANPCHCCFHSRTSPKSLEVSTIWHQGWEFQVGPNGTVGGRNPAPVEVGTLSPLFNNQVLYIPGGSGFLSSTVP